MARLLREETARRLVKLLNEQGGQSAPQSRIRISSGQRLVLVRCDNDEAISVDATPPVPAIWNQLYEGTVVGASADYIYEPEVDEEVEEQGIYGRQVLMTVIGHDAETVSPVLGMTYLGFVCGEVETDQDLTSPDNPIKGRARVVCADFGFVTGSGTGVGAAGMIPVWDSETSIKDSKLSHDDATGNVENPGSFTTRKQNPLGMWEYLAKLDNGQAVGPPYLDGPFLYLQRSTAGILHTAYLAADTNRVNLYLRPTYNFVLGGDPLNALTSITSSYAVRRGTLSAPTIHTGVDATLAPGMVVKGGIVTTAGSGAFVVSNVDNEFSTGQTIEAEDDADTPLTLVGAPGQTAPLARFQDEFGDDVLTIGIGSALFGSTSGAFDFDGDVTADNFIGNGSLVTALNASSLASGTAPIARLPADTDGALAANSDAVFPTQKAVKTYVDTLAAGLKWKAPVKVATTAAGTLATDFENGDTVDGVALVTGDRILIKNQAAAAQNGIYVVQAAGAPVRSTDADSEAELLGAAVFVSQGTVNADRAYVQTEDAITVGATAVTWVQFSGATGALIATNNLSDLTNAGTARTNLGLGTAAVANTGTTGHTVPFLDGGNTFQSYQKFDGQIGIFASTSAGKYLNVTSNEALTADRSLVVLVNDGNRTVTFAGNTTLSGTNTGDQTITLTGDVTGTGGGSFATTIANDAVTNAQAANMATARIKGRATAGTGDPEDLTAAQVVTMLGAFVVPASLAASGWADVAAYNNTSHSCTNGAWTTVQFDTEVTDTDGLFNPATYTFTPATTGVYLVEMGITLTGATLRTIGAVWVGTASLHKTMSDGVDVLAGACRLVTLSASTGYTFRVFVTQTGVSTTIGAANTYLKIRRVF